MSLTLGPEAPFGNQGDAPPDATPSCARTVISIQYITIFRDLITAITTLTFTVLRC